METSHYALTVTLLNRLRADAKWSSTVHSLDEWARDLYNRAQVADDRWIDYLDVDKSNLLGLSTAGLKQYVRWNINNTMTSVQLLPLYEKTANSMKWADKYYKLSQVQTAQKAKEGSSYLLGAIDMNYTWTSLKL